MVHELKILKAFIRELCITFMVDYRLLDPEFCEPGIHYWISYGDRIAINSTDWPAQIDPGVKLLYIFSGEHSHEDPCS